MIRQLLDGDYAGLELVHVPMRFSASTSEMGKPAVKKVIQLLLVIGRIWKARMLTGSRVLYYPPAGPNLIPVLRDTVILLATRWAFKRVIFHFHAGGVSEYVARLPWPFRALVRSAYHGADTAIVLSDLNPDDGLQLGAKTQVTLPNGIEDHAMLFTGRDRAAQPEVPEILFVGVLRESKGVSVLVDACHRLSDRAVPYRLRLVGTFDSMEYEASIRLLVQARGMANAVEFSGVLVGDEKWMAYARAQIFCFPTFFESETHGVVLLEAMQFGLPVVATSWRGVPSVVEAGETGLLVPVRDPAALADALERLLVDGNLRARMGQLGRRRYEQCFTPDRWRAAVGDILRGKGAVFAAISDQ